MERVHFLEHRGERILHVDLRGLRGLRGLMKVAREAAERMRGEPTGPHLVLVDLTGTPFSLRGLRELGEVAVGNAPYVRARAVVGTPRVADALLYAIGELSNVPVQSFTDREEAMDWLVGLAEGDRRPPA